MHIYTHDIDTIVIDYERKCMNGVIKIPYRGIFPGKKCFTKITFQSICKEKNFAFLLIDHYFHSRHYGKYTPYLVLKIRAGGIYETVCIIGHCL